MVACSFLCGWGWDSLIDLIGTHVLSFCLDTYGIIGIHIYGLLNGKNRSIK